VIEYHQDSDTNLKAFLIIGEKILLKFEYQFPNRNSQQWMEFPTEQEASEWLASYGFFQS